MKVELCDIATVEAVWWVDEKTYQYVSVLSLWQFEAPLYVGEQFNDAEGRPGRGRLWVDERFGDASIVWPRTHPNSDACSLRAGIVITWEAAQAILLCCRDAKYVPLITDDKLNTWCQI